MKKSDLRNGMVVELSNGDIKLVLQDNRCERLVLVNPINNRWLYLDDYSDNLTYPQRDSDDISDDDIDKIFESYTKYMWDLDKGLLWERKEIDWSKVLVGTKVMVRNDINSKWINNAIFIEKTNQGKFKILSKDKDCFSIWKYCELVEEPSKEVTLKELENKYCDFQDFECGNCYGCKYEEYAICEIAWLMDNYNVTRK